MGTLEKKVAIVTGAARGIGRKIAETFLREGCRVAMVDLAEPTPLTSGETISIAADVSKAKDVNRIVKTTVDRFGTLDILVNNAGILKDSSLLKMEEAQFDAVIDVNLKGVFLCGQACARVMSEKKKGRIINISSVAARGNFGQSNYSAAKAGVIGLTKTWAIELSKFNITVNAVAPGLIATEMTASIPPEVREKLIAKIPLARMGETQDVAEAVAFLASDEASYIQGEVIGVNGGFQT